MIHSFMQQTYVEPFSVPGQAVGTAHPAKRTHSPVPAQLSGSSQSRLRSDSKQWIKIFNDICLWGPGGRGIGCCGESGELVCGNFPEKVCFHE